MRRKEMKGEPRERSAVSLSREILWYSKIADRNSLVLLETDRPLQLALTITLGRSCVKVISADITARCYASAVLAMGLCPSVSVTSRSSIETAERIELVFGT